MLENDNNIEVDLDRLRKAVAKLRPTRRKIMNLVKVHFSLWDEVEDIWWDLMYLEDEIDSLLDGREPTRHREQQLPIRGRGHDPAGERGGER